MRARRPQALRLPHRHPTKRWHGPLPRAFQRRSSDPQTPRLHRVRYRRGPRGRSGVFCRRKNKALLREGPKLLDDGRLCAPLHCDSDRDERFARSSRAVWLASIISSAGSSNCRRPAVNQCIAFSKCSIAPRGSSQSLGTRSRTTCRPPSE